MRARCPPNRFSTASSIMSRMSDPLMPAFATARQAMISRSWASMMKAPRTTSPFQQVNSKPSSTSGGSSACDHLAVVGARRPLGVAPRQKQVVACMMR
jgi:hypothetical protein